MSEPPIKPPRRVLPVVGKSLMPEVLPRPLHAGNLDGSPRARVLKRLAQLSERAAALAAVASISAACNSGGGGYMTVDPAPAPAGMGGPLVPPSKRFVCPDPDSTLIDVSVFWKDSASFHVAISPSADRDAGNLSIAGASSSASSTAELLGPRDVIVTAPGGDPAAWPASIDLNVELQCVDSQQQLSSYVLVLRVETRRPGLGILSFTVVDEDDADGGT